MGNNVIIKIIIHLEHNSQKQVALLRNLQTEQSAQYFILFLKTANNCL